MAGGWRAGNVRSSCLRPADWLPHGCRYHRLGIILQQLAFAAARCVRTACLQAARSSAHALAAARATPAWHASAPPLFACRHGPLHAGGWQLASCVVSSDSVTHSCSSAGSTERCTQDTAGEAKQQASNSAAPRRPAAQTGRLVWYEQAQCSTCPAEPPSRSAAGHQHRSEL